MSEEASRNLRQGVRYPYHRTADGEAYEPEDWCERAALGILYDLGDRRGVKHELERIDADVRADLVRDLSDIIRTAHAEADRT